jgi:hypothetical protein
MRVLSVLLSSLEARMTDLQELSFLLSLLVALPFGVLEDVFFAINGLSKLLSFHAVTALDDLKVPVSSNTIGCAHLN